MSGQGYAKNIPQCKAVDLQGTGNEPIVLLYRKLKGMDYRYNHITKCKHTCMCECVCMSVCVCMCVSVGE